MNPMSLDVRIGPRVVKSVCGRNSSFVTAVIRHIMDSQQEMNRNTESEKKHDTLSITNSPFTSVPVPSHVVPYGPVNVAKRDETNRRSTNGKTWTLSSEHANSLFGLAPSRLFNKVPGPTLTLNLLSSTYPKRT